VQAGEQCPGQQHSRTCHVPDLTAAGQAQSPSTELVACSAAAGGGTSPHLLAGVANLAGGAQAAAALLAKFRRERMTLSLQRRGAAVTPVLTEAATHILVFPEGEPGA
jgi:hypothetical protein